MKQPLSSRAQNASGYGRLDGGQWKITAHHTLVGITPAMVDWWWDHLNPERYKRWHPTDHISFEWIVPPTHGHVGAIHRVKEFLNGFPDQPLELEIRWEHPVNAPVPPEYSHVLLATGTERGGKEILRATLMHEYDVVPTRSSGIRMRSHFWFPPQTPEQVIHSLYQHNRQEMLYLAQFLPDVYRAEAALSA